MDVWAVGPDRVRRGQLEVLSWAAIPRDCDEGTWTLTLVDDDLSRRVVEGWRVILQDGDVTLMSGLVLSYGEDVTDDTLTLSGVDDLFPLASGLTYPDPTKAATAQTSAAYYKRTGPAETVIRDMVHANVGTGAIAARRSPGFTVTVSQGRGGSVTTNLRFKNLLEESRTLARSGGVTFSAVQEEDTRSVLRFREPVDRSRWVRFARGDDGGLTGGSYAITAPTVTNVLVAGQGQGTDRTIKEHTADPGAWGMRIEAFQDRRDTDDPDELEAAGADTLAEGAASASATVEVEEVPGLIYGVDYQLGDTVLVDFGRAQITEPVRAVELTGDAFGRTAKLTLGDHAAEDDNTPAWDKQIRALARRLRGLETI